MFHVGWTSTKRWRRGNCQAWISFDWRTSKYVATCVREVLRLLTCLHCDGQEVFDYLDVDRSGAIDLVELKEAMKFIGVSHENSKLIQQFNFMDDNGDGTLDFDEFSKVMLSDIFSASCCMCKQ